MPPSTAKHPREGMMAVVRNRRAMVTGVKPFDAAERGRFHMVEVEYTDGLGAETDRLLWEVEPDAQVLEPSALPRVADQGPMDPREFDAMVRAARWSALTPTLPFSGLEQDRPPLAAPLYGAVHVEGYQLVPLLRALEMPRVAMLLADAVGLGKTIQAGLILRELMLRRRIRRIVILCPAALRTQWRDEMEEKFSLPFQVVDRPHHLQLQRQLGIDANPWRTHERIIASYHYLKQPDVLEQFRSTAEPGTDGTLRWDLIVVDEAHNLAPANFGRDSDLSRMLQQVSPWFEHRLFLTATPHNGHTRCFSGLLEALDPVRFTRKSEFNDEDRRRVGETVVRRLKSEINRCHVSLGEAPRFSDRTVLALEPPLRFGLQERTLQEAFHDFRKALRAIFHHAAPSETFAAAFSLEVLQKRLLSGPWPFGQSWLALLEGLDEGSVGAEAVSRASTAVHDDTDDDAERESRQRHAERTVGAWLRAWKDRLVEPIAEVTAAVHALGVERVERDLDPKARAAEVARLAPKVKQDARLNALFRFIDERLRAGTAWRPDERLVVFTEYLATLDYLRARIQARYGEGKYLLSLFGGMTDDERDAVKQAFNDAGNPVRILLGTDAASEGLNLQRTCRLLLHWDIPWNPSRMEQRNGRLDRHGQERDVTIFHFDSYDDASLRFLGLLLKKRSQTREDRVATDEIFAGAILAHFDKDEDADRVDEEMDKTLRARKAQAGPDDVPETASLPGAEDAARLDALRAEVDLSPESLRETLETSMAIEAGRPRLKPDGYGRDRLVHPVPAIWNELVDRTLRVGGPTGSLQALVFDPEHYVRNASGRPVFVPEKDSRLLHLGHALYHRVMASFARYRFPGGPASSTRWTVRTCSIPANLDALVLLTVEELAVNDLRESCHHWIRTLRLPVVGGKLVDPLPHEPAARFAAPPTVGDIDIARDLWEDVKDDVGDVVKGLQKVLTASLASRLQEAGVQVAAIERARFKRRRDELKKALDENRIEKLRKEAEKTREDQRQVRMFGDIDADLAKKLSDIEAELELRKSHYETVLNRLAAEEERTLKMVLPPRYTLRGEARVYPVAVEIRLPGGAV